MLLDSAQIREITQLQRPKAQARKLRELGFIVIGFSARGEVRALADHPMAPSRSQDPVRMHLQ
jgi:hypothetical protein